MKRFFILILFSMAAIIVIQIPVSAKYIVQLDVQLMSAEDTGLEPLVPELGLYTAEDISDIDPAMLESVEEDVRVELFDSYDYTETASQPWHTITGAKGMWDIGAYGQRVRVGVIDSGCNPHVALAGSFLEGRNVIDTNNDVTDNIGHGTSVCGVIAAGYGFDVIGAAHKAEVVPFKFIDCDDNGKTIGGYVSQVIAAINSAVEDYQCDVINMSFGTVMSQNLKKVIDDAVSKGVTFVAAVGNEGDDTERYPASYDNVIGAGSVDNSKQHSYFSNINDSVFVTAPGEHIKLLSDINEYKINSGTSFSSPYVCGVIADMISIKPDITPDEIKSIISSTAEDLGEAGKDNMFGYGLIRADKIVDYMLAEEKCYTPGIDLCSEDGFYEMRFRTGDNYEDPACIFAEYKDGMLKRTSMQKQRINDHVFMLRLPREEYDSYKYFVWESFESMKPL